MTTNDMPEGSEKLAWDPPRLELLGTMDDVRSGGVQGGPDFDFDPSDPAS
jgi:hypothetical protein